MFNSIEGFNALNNVDPEVIYRWTTPLTNAALTFIPAIFKWEADSLFEQTARYGKFDSFLLNRFFRTASFNSNRLYWTTALFKVGRQRLKPAAGEVEANFSFLEHEVS